MSMDVNSDVATEGTYVIGFHVKNNTGTYYALINIMPPRTTFSYIVLWLYMLYL